MDLSKPAHAKYLWKKIEPFWDHRDLPSGHRFLGSVRIERKATEEILDVVQKSLSTLDYITFAQLQRKFGTWDFTWIKVLTLALSEYAYYDNGEQGYWQGLCDRLDIQQTQGSTKALQQVVWQGIEDLGLVCSSKANRYVSSLWLQSGIPQQSVGHFADLVQSLDYDWWDIAHADPADLAQLLCDICEQKFSQRGRLLTFLRSSCPEDNEEDVDPISGTLLQGLATVAHELERRGESPEMLRDENQRTRILQNYSLPNTFFLRSWDSLINVLTPRRKRGARQTITSQRKKPLSLVLDITDSFDIQLVLPEQQIYRKEWKSLQAEYCTISEADWEGGIDLNLGTLQVPELRQTLAEASNLWIWQLMSHQGAVLLEWHHEGIQTGQLCLIFDADTGELRSPQQLELSSEIILFTPNNVDREYGNTIEIIDSFVPCSLEGWRGHLLQRREKEADIILHQESRIQKISWHQCSYQQPELQGIRLKSHKTSFLGTPTLWYPPEPISKTLNVLVEDLTRRHPISQTNEQVTVSASANWQELDLSQWIKNSGLYSIRLWNNSSQWVASFEIQKAFQLVQSPQKQDFDVLDRQQILINEFPIKCPTSQDFWLEELTIKGLWPLEESVFELTNGQNSIRISKKANSSGSTLVSLASFRDAIPEAERYSLLWIRNCKSQQLMSFNCDEETWVINTNDTSINLPLLDEKIPKNNESKEDHPIKASVYWIELGKRNIKQFQQLISSQIQEEGLREMISVSYDRSIPEFVIVRVGNQNYEPVLKTMCSSIEQKLHRKITLIRR